MAANAGHLEICKMLLEDPRVDPGECVRLRKLLTRAAVDDNIAFQMACQCGRTEVVRLLLAHPNVDPCGWPHFGD